MLGVIAQEGLPSWGFIAYCRMLHCPVRTCVMWLAMLGAIVLAG